MYIKTIPGKGRAVYASSAIKKGAVIEECELIVIPKKDRPYVKKTIIDEYYYEWSGGRTVFVLGNGSLYNHSFTPNARYTHDYKRQKMVYTAIHAIKKDEEITVNYNGDPGDQSTALLWFSVVEQSRTEKVNGAGRGGGASLTIKKDGKKGRGVYAVRAIKQGSVIEECEVIFIPKKDLPYLKKTQIDSYYYCWKAAAAMPLGFGVLYNHSFNPNAEWKDDFKNRRMTLYARREIKKDEEVTINYNGNPKDQSRSLIWFPVIENEVKKKK